MFKNNAFNIQGKTFHTLTYNGKEMRKKKGKKYKKRKRKKNTEIQKKKKYKFIHEHTYI